MIGTLIGIIFTVIIIGVIWWAIQQLLPLMPIAEPFATIVRVLMTVILVLVVIYVIWQLVVASGVSSMGMPAIGHMPR